MTEKPETPKSDIEKAAEIIATGIGAAGCAAGCFIMLGLIGGGMLSRPSSSSMDGIWVKHGIEQLGEDVKDGFEIQGCLASGRKWTGYSCEDKDE